MVQQKLTRKRMMQLPLRRTRMPQKGRPSRNRYRNTSDLSNGVQRANVSGNVPPTKFEAARSRFFVGRDGVSHPRNAEMRFSFRRSPKLSFSREKLLTAHYHEPTHISHQWTCESVSGSHLRERSDAGRNTTHPLDPDKDQDGTAGSISSLQSKARTKPRFLG